MSGLAGVVVHIGSSFDRAVPRPIAGDWRQLPGGPSELALPHPTGDAAIFTNRSVINLSPIGSTDGDPPIAGGAFFGAGHDLISPRVG